MILTDHDTFANSYIIRDIAREKYNDSIKVLIGEEWSTKRCHLNFIFPPNTTITAAFPHSDYPTDDEIRDVVQEVHDLGGIVVINHYPWSTQVAKMENHPNRTLALSLGIDYIEVVNEWDYDGASVDFCQQTGMYQISGSDMHNPYGVYSWTAMNVSEITEENIFLGLKAGQTDIIYNCSGAYYENHDTLQNKFVRPWILLGKLLLNYSYDWSGILILGMYIYGAFFLAEAFIYIGKKASLKIMPKLFPKFHPEIFSIAAEKPPENDTT